MGALFPHDDILNTLAAEFIAQQSADAEAVTADTDMPPELRIVLIKQLRDETGMDLKTSADVVREYLYRCPHREYDARFERRCQEISSLRDTQKSGDIRKPWWRFWGK